MKIELKEGDKVFCNGSYRPGIIIRYFARDYLGRKLWEMHDGEEEGPDRHQWLCPEEMIFRLPDNWDRMSRAAQESFKNMK